MFVGYQCRFHPTKVDFRVNPFILGEGYEVIARNEESEVLNVIANVTEVIPLG